MTIGEHWPTRPLGLALNEAKDLLTAVQAAVVDEQVTAAP
jgi:hypothetical protein